ncbi:hypothetical protein CP01DC11_0006B, partial [Chlamydia psittaci 01DC11]
KVSVT